MFDWPRGSAVFHYVAYRLIPVNSIEPNFFCRIQRQKKVFKDMASFDQYGRSSRRQSLLNTDRVCHANRHIIEPDIPGKGDLAHAVWIIISVRYYAVTNHCAPKELDRGILFHQRKLRYLTSLWNPCHNTTMSAVRCLSYSTTE